MNYSVKMQYIPKELKRSKFVRNVLSLITGNSIAQVILIFCTPLITRLYTPENLGSFSLFTAVVNIFALVGSLCYERAIVLPKKNNDAINVVLLSLLILLLVTLLTFFITYLFSHSLGVLLKNKDFIFWVKMSPFAILLVGSVNIFNYWLIRNKRFKTIAYARAWNAALSSGIKITIGFYIGAHIIGLVGGFTFGWIASLFILCVKLDIKIIERLKNISRNNIHIVAKEYKQFPLFASWNVLLNVSSQYLIVFMLSFFFGPVIVGFYSLVDKVLRQPIFVTSQSVQNVLFQKGAELLSSNKPLMPALAKTLFGLSFIGIFPFGLLTIFSKQLFGLFFGAEWVQAGVYVQILAPWFYLMFLNSVTNVVYEITRRQDLKLKINIIYAFMRFSALYGGYVFFKTPEYVLALFVFVNIIFEIFLAAGAFFISKKQDFAVLEYSESAY